MQIHHFRREQRAGRIRPPEDERRPGTWLALITLYAAGRPGGPAFELPSAEPHAPAITALWQIAIIGTSWGRGLERFLGHWSLASRGDECHALKMAELLVALANSPVFGSGNSNESYFVPLDSSS
jgi:hypothetical protein